MLERMWIEAARAYSKVLSIVYLEGSFIKSQVTIQGPYKKYRENLSLTWLYTAARSHRAGVVVGGLTFNTL
jgi:hypothetical protein